MRLTHLTNSLAPYRIQQYNALGKMCEFSLVVLRRDSKIRNWKIDKTDLSIPVYSVESPQINIRRMDWELNLSYWSAAKAVAQTNPDVVYITGYDCPGCWAVLRWAKRNRVPVLMFCASNAFSSRTKGRRFIDAWKRYFISRCDAFIVPSEFSARYVTDFGADPEKIVVGGNCCDIDKFPSCERIEDGSGPVLLFAGQLVERKGVIQMMSALERVSDISWRLKIAGVGPLMERMREWVSKCGFADRVEFLGYVQQNELSRVYRRADILLFPSLLEPYGIVVLEAMFSGVYVLSSDLCAISHQVLKPGINGALLPVRNEKGFAAAVRKAVAGLPYDRRKIRATVEHMTPQVEAETVMAAVHVAISAVRNRRSASDSTMSSLA